MSSVSAERNLARLRAYTWWGLLFFVVALGGTTAVVAVGRFGADEWPLAVTLVAGVGLLAAAATVVPLRRSLVRPPLAWGWPDGTALGVGAGGTAAGAVVSAVADEPWVGWAVLAGLVFGAAGVRLAGWRRRAVLTVVPAVAGASPAIADLAVGLVGAGAALLICWSVWLQWWYYDVATRLDAARAQAAELAVANERLRFAAELHDIQGHHLQVIALKSELAARLVTTRPDAAAAEVTEIQRLAREALTDTRAVVGGYRKVALATEIANATRVLEAAGVDARPRLAAGEVSGEVGRVLGLVVREASTNILRHAHARTARIELTRRDGEVRLVVANDGAAAVPSPLPTGGLAGLADRVAAAGGRLRWGAERERFEVTATVPDGAP